MARCIASLVAFALVSLAGPLLAQAQPNVVTRELTMTATVDRIESGRVVTFRGEGNTLQTVYVDPQVKAFDDLKVGDVVTIRYVEAVIVQVRPDAKLTDDILDTTEEARKGGNENVVQQLREVVTIEDIDSQGLFVTYRTGDNRRVVRAAPDKRLLQGVRRGDRVEVTLTRDRAVSIERGRR